MIYTTILHEVRENFDLSFTEYILADLITLRANNPEHWCFQSRTSMSKELGITTRQINKCLAVLVEKGVVERNENNPQLVRPSKVWINAISSKEQNSTTPEQKFTPPEQKDRVTPEQKFPEPLNKSSDINNQLNNLKEITNEKERKKKFSPPKLNEVEEYFYLKGLRGDQIIIEAEKFYNFYEANGWKVGKNKMQKWKAAGTGWLSRMKEFNSSKQLSKEQQRQVNNHQAMRESFENEMMKIK